MNNCNINKFNELWLNKYSNFEYFLGNTQNCYRYIKENYKDKEISLSSIYM